MKYRNANDVLPKELLVLVQEYIQGEYIYVPVKNKHITKSSTQYKTELEKRDAHIYTKYLEGMHYKRLSQIYNLSESSIRRIIAKQRKGGFDMKVSVELSPEYKEPYAIIYADKITDSIQRTLDIFSLNESPITALQNEKDIVILRPKEIYMVRVENKDTIIYGKEHSYRSQKRLYEMQQQLGAGFMQISKSTLVNLSYMSNVEAGFSGTLLLKLKNGCKDYVSRKYLPEFKKYLGL